MLPHVVVVRVHRPEVHYFLDQREQIEQIVNVTHSQILLHRRLAEINVRERSAAPVIEEVSKGVGTAWRGQAIPDHPHESRQENYIGEQLK